jgi:DNA-binding PadR family transcriptional regulator
LEISKFLPLSEATYYVMLALDEPRHGYAVMQAVEAMSGGAVTIGPGTLYGAFNTLEKQKLIEKVSEEERRKIFGLTDLGRGVLVEQIHRLELMVRNGRSVAQRLKGAA